jgi:hypothetical protein
MAGLPHHRQQHAQVQPPHPSPSTQCRLLPAAVVVEAYCTAFKQHTPGLQAVVQLAPAKHHPFATAQPPALTSITPLPQTLQCLRLPQG